MEYFDKKAVGFRIKQLRRKESMTQQQLAERLCYATERQVQRIENGEISCPVDRLMEIAQIFNISTDYLLFGKEIVLSQEKKRTIGAVAQIYNMTILL